MNLNENLKWRYATKKFDTNNKVTQEKINAILEAGNLSASSLGMQPYKFVAVTNEELKAKLVPASYGQTQVGEATCVVVLAARTDINQEYINKYTAYSGKLRGTDAESLAAYNKMITGFIGSMGDESKLLWATKQCYIALGTMMAACADYKVDACPIEGFMPDQYDEILDLSAINLRSVVVLAVGHRSAEDKYQKQKKVRLPLDKIVVRF